MSDTTLIPVQGELTTAPEATQLADTLAASVAAALVPKQIGDAWYVTTPTGYRLENISEAVERARDNPLRKRGTVALRSIESLLLYCEDQATHGKSKGYIYADPDALSITAVFNDHRSDAAGWRDHRVEFKAEKTPEFARWMSRNGSSNAMEQTAFAEFVEDNLADITEPAAQKLLEVATTIQAKTAINFNSARRLDNGQIQLGYTETIEARAGAEGALEIPREFQLGLRIFKNGEGYALRARLKYRLHSGTVKFWYELDRPERAVEDAFAGYVATVSEKSGYTVLIGKP